MSFQGVALAPSPLCPHRVTLEPSPWRPARVLHKCFLARILAKHSIFALVFFTSIFPFITIFSLLTFTQLLLSVVQTFCTSAVLFRVCKVHLRYEIWIQHQSRRHQIWPLPIQNKGNFGSVLTAHHVCLRFYMIIIPYALSAEIRYVI